MSSLGDHLHEIEFDLAKNGGDGEEAALCRRMALRRALTTWGDERFQEGYHEGRRDMIDARSEARRRADGPGTTAATAGED